MLRRSIAVSLLTLVATTATQAKVPYQPLCTPTYGQDRPMRVPLVEHVIIDESRDLELFVQGDTVEQRLEDLRLLRKWVARMTSRRIFKTGLLRQITANRQLWLTFARIFLSLMNCPSCKTEQADTSRFCSACGAALRPDIEATVAHEPASPAAGSSVRSSLFDSSHHGRFLPGTDVADRYRIVSLIGKGGMGEVYRADDLKLGHTVALKFLPKELANDLQRLEYFHNEVRLTRQVSHPNVCRMYDIAEVDGQHFLSMEYIDGEDLKILLRRIGRLPQDKGIQIAQQICAGLGAAHEKGVLHRDLKPANIMIDGKGQVRITDFGLAKLAEDGKRGEVVGTPAYMAPEQIACGEATIKSDLYSLGLILHELFTGEAVYKAGSIPELQQAHESAELVPPSRLIDDMEPAVERAILRCLEMHPDRRPRSAAALASALPGGDPLAAALAAGETPSPEMVANAAVSELMPLRTGVAWLCGMLMLLVAAAFLASKASILSESNLDTPVSLVRDSQDIINDLGYTEPTHSTAYGFTPVLPADHRMGRSSMSFWYRQSTRPLIPTTRLSWVVTFDDPVAAMPGMLGVRLDSSDGRLMEFRAVPSANSEATSATTEDSAKLLFEKAQLDWTSRADLNSGDSYLYPLVRCDEQRAWRARWTGYKEETVFVRASFFQGRPVFFQVSPNVTTDPRIQSVVYDDKRLYTKPDSLRTIEWLAQLVMLFAAIPLARWNLRLGRCDQKTAFRLGSLTFSVYMLAWFLQANHAASLYGEVSLLLSGLIWAAFMAGIWWLGYLAIEPFVRRIWPNALITWNRLFSGRYSDPLVGRDLLIGATLGIFTSPCLTMLFMVIHGHVTEDSSWEWLVQRPDSLLGPTQVIAQLLFCFNDALLQGLYFLFSMFLLKLAIRRPLPIFIAFVLLWGVSYSTVVLPGMGPNPGIISRAMAGLNFCAMAAVWATLMTRFGLLAFVAALFSTWVLDGFPITADLSASYAGNGRFAMAAVLVVGLYGFYTSSLSGRKLIADQLME